MVLERGALLAEIGSHSVPFKAVRRTRPDGHRCAASAVQGPRLGRGPWPRRERQIVHAGDVRSARQVLGSYLERQGREHIMSVQYGRWNWEGQPPAPDYLEKVSAALAPYGPDSSEAYSKGDVDILFHAFHTTKESRREKQPYVSPSGAVITWDGRLDNRAELRSDLRDAATTDSTDVALVSAAYDKWSTDCFAKLVGDWALSIWNSNTHSLILAKDPIGTRHLYYSFDDNQVTWSTILEPLVLFLGKTFPLNEEYVAGWFYMFLSAHLPPCVGILSVPPSSSVLLRPGKHTVRKYWDFDPHKRIRYRTDREYEEHFRTV